VSDAAALLAGVRAGDRVSVGRAITLVESTLASDRARAAALLAALADPDRDTLRIGVSGAPGVGKSTFIEAFGLHAIAQGHRVAVLAVDPSSPRSGGSILGDKTRMVRLARDPAAFVRPSPSGTASGGVAGRTREVLAVLEAAGHDVAIVETVGVGQSEHAVASLVDVFVVLVQPGAGDDLQAIKRGNLELCDLAVVTKADGETAAAAARARSQYEHALALVPPRTSSWTPRVLACSAVTGTGIADVWSAVLQARDAWRASGEWTARRGDQSVQQMWQSAEDAVLSALHEHPRVAAAIAQLETDVRAGTLAPDEAARRLAAAFVGPGAPFGTGE
jgi:LAO/AO transport system kinase